MATAALWRWGAVLLLAAVWALTSVSFAAAKAPAACKLLTRPLAEDYFNTDMSKTSGVHDRCEWVSRIPDLHRSASLTVVSWAYLPNAKSSFKLSCSTRGTNHPKKVSLPGADQACATAGYTGICFDKPTGQVCIWQIAIAFRRGSATGELDTVAPKPYSINSVPHATALARKVLARWH